jgi:beta-lactamase class C
MVTGSPPTKLRNLAERIINDPSSPFYTPGIGIVIARADGSRDQAFAGTDAAGRPMREDTLFPLASASKLATGLALLRLVDDGAFAFDDPLARYAPEALAARPDVTIRRLLSHTSGLPLDLSPELVSYDRSLDWRKLAAGCLNTPLRHEPATRVEYSNVAYGLLGVIMERVTGQPFRTIVETLVIEPLGIEAYVSRVPPRPLAAISGLDSPHVGTEIEPFNSEWSQQLTMPWSGVCTTAAGLLALAQAYAGDGPPLVRPATLAEARADQTHGLSGGFGTTDPFIGFNGSKRVVWSPCAWGLTVEVRGTKRPHWTPPKTSPTSFGQLGSSGCLAWCDMEHGVSWAVIGPRTTDNGWILRQGGAIGTLAYAGGEG